MELRDGIWRGRYLVDVPGQHARRKVSVALGARSELTKCEARRKLQRIILGDGINAAAYRIPSELTFRQHVRQWELSYLVRRKPSTQATMQWHIKTHLIRRWGGVPVDAIAADKVNEWIGTLDLSPSTIRGVIKTLQIVIGRKFGRGAIAYPSQIAEEDEVRCFTPAEVSRILAAATGQDKVLFTLAAETGMRAGELYGLHVEDIDFDRGVIHVRRSMWGGREQCPKTKNARRTIDVQPYVLALLRSHLNGRSTGLVFRSKCGTPFKNVTILHRHLHPLLGKLGIERAGMHAFRHFRVSFLMEQNVPVELIKRWIGHGSEAMIRRYTHLRSDYRQQVLAQLPPVNGAKFAQIAPIAPRHTAYAVN